MSSRYGVFVYGSGARYGDASIDPATLAIARSIMSRFHSGQVVNKDSEDTLQFRLILALAESIGEFVKEANATHDDNFLSTSRREHIEDVWTPLLGAQYNNDWTLAENIEFYRGLIKLFLFGYSYNGLGYIGQNPVNIITAVYLFTKITKVRLFEAWRDSAIMFGAPTEVFQIGALDPATESVIGGAALTGPAGPTGSTGLIRAGAQLVVPLDNFLGPNTDGVVAARDLFRPAGTSLAIVYEVGETDIGGGNPAVVNLALGLGNSGSTGLAHEIIRVAAFQTYTDSNYLPVAYPTQYVRYFAVVPKELIYGPVAITEAGIFQADGTMVGYKTFPPVNKTDALDVLIAWNVHLT